MDKQLASAREGNDAPPDIQEALQPLAKQSLAYFEITAAQAAAALAENGKRPPDAFAVTNALTEDRAHRTLAGISQERRDDCLRLTNEPAIARIVVLDEDDKEQVVFITRGTPIVGTTSEHRSASYRAPMGRLASLEVGDDLDVTIPDGTKRNYEVLERAKLRPTRVAGEWDALNTAFDSRGLGPITVVSLRALLLSADDEASDLNFLASLVAAERNSSNVIDGLTRSVVEKMGLRDQPLLDRYQDEIFRLPLDTRLAILGPPGAGKTTTLIKRLGLKLDIHFLDKDERDQISLTSAGEGGHPASWLMFTPTELLKQYVKEAFAREGIAASDLRIQTWADYRRSLGRQRLGILRTTGSRGAVLRETLEPLNADTASNPIGWYEDFQTWQGEQFWLDLAQQAARLADNDNPSIAAIGKRLIGVIPSNGDRASSAAFLAISGLSKEITKQANELRERINARVNATLSSHVRQDRSLLNSLAAFVRELGDIADTSEDADDHDFEEDEDEPSARRGELEQALEIYKRAVRTQARAAALKRSIGRKTRNGRVLEWLGERSLAEPDRRDVGQMLLTLTSLQRFANPLRRYLGGVLTRYRRFRRDRQALGRWYTEAPFTPADLGPSEVDAVILATLRAGRALLQDRRIQSAIDLPAYSGLKEIQDLFRNQIVVDEATDFSAIQLACMAQLTDPAVESFVLCGDFNQRITTWGARSEDDLRWIFPDMDIRSIVVSYRHSRQLAELSEGLVGLSGGNPLGARLPEHMINEGFAPVLAMGLAGDAEIDWLSARIREIDEHLGGKLPSIAVLVDTEDKVGPLAIALNNALSDRNIRCTACPGGQVRGQDNDVRVFDVKHIKGLEFEAVFFVGIDALAVAQPDLFDKFLYVGATRAATYLGLTCASNEVPAKLQPLLDVFSDAWVAAR